MPQLMPLFWNLSLFMVLYIIIIMSIMYFVKLLDYNLIYLNMDKNLIDDEYSYLFFKW